MMASQQIKLLCFFKVIWYYCFIDYHNKWKCNTKMKKKINGNKVVNINCIYISCSNILLSKKNQNSEKRWGMRRTSEYFLNVIKGHFHELFYSLGKFICALLFIYMLIKVKTPYSSYMLTWIFVLRRKDNPKVMTLLPITSFVSKRILFLF